MWVPAQCGSNIMNLKYSWRWPRRQPAYVLECDEARDPQRGCRHDVMPVRPLAADCLLEVGTTWLEATHNWHTVRGPESQPWVAPDSTACTTGSQPASNFQVQSPVWAWLAASKNQSCTWQTACRLPWSPEGWWRSPQLRDLVTRNKSTSPVFRWSLLRRHPQFH